VLLRQGDEEAIEKALALLQNTIFSFSMKVCGQREDAEDTSQEVLLKSIPPVRQSQGTLGMAIQSGQDSLPDEPPQEQIRSQPRTLTRAADARPQRTAPVQR